MSTFNKKEHGQFIYVNLGTDISSGTNYKVILQPQRGDKKEFTTNVAIASKNITVDDQKFLANEYLIYIIQEDDLDQEGQWRIRGSAVVSGVLIKSDYTRMTVLA